MFTGTLKVDLGEGEKTYEVILHEVHVNPNMTEARLGPDATYHTGLKPNNPDGSHSNFFPTRMEITFSGYVIGEIISENKHFTK